MSKYVLECQCGSNDFEYDGMDFICMDCGHDYSEENAGKNLIAEEE